MSYYFAIVSTRDTPLFELTFGTSKGGGDGQARFPSAAQKLNPYILHAALDFVDQLQWVNNAMYLRRIDSFSSAQISCFLTPTSTRFLLLHLPHPPNVDPSSSANPSSTTQSSVPTSAATAFAPFIPYTAKATSSSTSGSASIPNNATSPATEEAIRMFFGEVFEVWIKAVMNPFQGVEEGLRSRVFGERVRGAGRKYL